jgi:predicted phage terminase large subunit-like protein
MTVDCHGPLCAFIDLNPGQFKLMLMPRDHLKTTVITIGANMQKVVKNVEERILIANESSTNAERMLRAIRQQVEGNRVFRALYGDIIPKDTRKVRWNDSELDFARQGHYPEPTIDSIGMTGAVTSRHYTHINYDDPISEEAVKSEKVMVDTINRMSGALSLLTDPSKHTIWLVGTRWALHDVYSVWMKTFGTRLVRLVRAAIEDGEPIWPERFSLDTLALKRTQQGEYKFSCLMMNNPRNPELQDLAIDDANEWAWSPDGDVILYQRGVELCRWSLDDLDITTTVDLAPSEKVTSDRNAVTTVGVSPRNQAIVLDAWGKRCTPLDVIDKLFEVKQRFGFRAVGIEDVAYQKAFKYFLKQACEDRGVYMNVVPLKGSTIKKTTRIRGLQPIMATGRMFIRADQHLLRNEIADFPLGEHDDVVDSLSMHLQMFRGQMSPERWDRYKASEKDLLNRIRSGRTSMRLIKPADFDHDDEDDEAPRPEIVERVIA